MAALSLPPRLRPQLLSQRIVIPAATCPFASSAPWLQCSAQRRFQTTSVPKSKGWTQNQSSRNPKTTSNSKSGGNLKLSSNPTTASNPKTTSGPKATSNSNIKTSSIIQTRLIPKPSSPPKIAGNLKPIIDPTTNEYLAKLDIEFSSLLNPPPSTLPAPLELPQPRKPGEGRAKHIWTTGKAYLKFYKAGMKQTVQNLYAARALRKQINFPFLWQTKLLQELAGEGSKLLSKGKNEATTTPATITPSPTAAPSTSPVDTVNKLHERVSRAQFQFLTRERSDTVRLPIFAIILLICGEWTPALVLLFGGIVPRTCRIPRQIRGRLEKLHRKRDERLARVAVSMREKGTLAMLKNKAEQEGIDRNSLVYALSYRLGTFSVASDFFLLTEKRVQRRLRYLDADDALLRRDSGGSSAVAVNRLSLEEVRISCDERGIDVLRKTGEKGKKGQDIWADVPEAELRRELKDWLQTGGWNERATESFRS